MASIGAVAGEHFFGTLLFGAVAGELCAQGLDVYARFETFAPKTTLPSLCRPSRSAAPADAEHLDVGVQVNKVYFSAT